MEALFKQMEDFAKENKVPIINENGRKVFIEIIKKILATKSFRNWYCDRLFCIINYLLWCRKCKDYFFGIR